jgi:hypothetical protein
MAEGKGLDWMADDVGEKGGCRKEEKVGGGWGWVGF